MKQTPYFFLLLLILFFASCNNHGTVINSGIGGNTTKDLLHRVDEDVFNYKPDLVIVMVGTNDMLNSGKWLSYEEYSSNLSKLVRQFKEKKIELVLMSPPTVDSAYLFLRHDKNLYTQTPNEKLDSAAAIMEGIAKEEDVHFFNLRKKFIDMGLPVHNEDEFILNQRNGNRKDGVHLTALGYSFVADQLYQYLKANELLSKRIKIVCFGDSITLGIYVLGSGTAEGETYPAQLQQLIISKK